MHANTDTELKIHGVYFLPWIGRKYCQGFHERKFLILGESHYTIWDERNHSPLPQDFTRACIEETVIKREVSGDHRFWKRLEQVILNQPRANDGWCPDGGHALWQQLAFYNYLQVGLLAPGHRPTQGQFNDSWKPFWAVLNLLRPERILVCGKELWCGMETTHEELHANIQAYRLDNGENAWCLAIRHPSRWLPSHELIVAFLDDPKSAKTFLEARH